MPDTLTPTAPLLHWPDGLTRVPFQAYRDAAVYEAEQPRLFEGPTWNFLCLETEIPNPGDWRATFVGRMPVVVVRDEQGEIRAFENRCAHRGALICLDDGGNAKDFTCVYHAWRYDLCGNLRSVAFGRGVNGKGGMPASFKPEHHGPRKLRTTTLFGLVFVTLSDATEAIEGYIGPDVLARIGRVANGKKTRDHRPPHRGAAEQLETLRRERARHLPRQPAASGSQCGRVAFAMADRWRRVRFLATRQG
jgi:anthranilate 1,2-dioxygenase large subunit/terephthalate 1,2-dioxygenase oxygenase component alpha subunit